MPANRAILEKITSLNLSHTKAYAGSRLKNNSAPSDKTVNSNIAISATTTLDLPPSAPLPPPRPAPPTPQPALQQEQIAQESSEAAQLISKKLFDKKQHKNKQFKKNESSDATALLKHHNDSSTTTATSDEITVKVTPAIVTGKQIGRASCRERV